MAPFCARGYHVPYLVELWGGEVRRVWLRVALAAGAGLASLVVCSGVLVAIVVLFLSTTDWFVIMGSSSWPSPIFWVGLAILIIVAAAGLSLPARALGAKRDHVTNTAVLSVLGLCAFVVFLVVSLVKPFVGVPLALLALVATPVIGSLFAIREDYHYTVRLVRATVIAAVAIYCASLFAYWIVTDAFGFTIDFGQASSLGWSWPPPLGPSCRVSWRCFAPVDAQPIFADRRGAEGATGIQEQDPHSRCTSASCPSASRRHAGCMSNRGCGVRTLRRNDEARNSEKRRGR